MVGGISSAAAAAYWPLRRHRPAVPMGTRASARARGVPGERVLPWGGVCLAMHFRNSPWPQNGCCGGAAGAPRWNGGTREGEVMEFREGFKIFGGYVYIYVTKILCGVCHKMKHRPVSFFVNQVFLLLKFKISFKMK